MYNLCPCQVWAYTVVGIDPKPRHVDNARRVQHYMHIASCAMRPLSYWA